MRLALSPRLGCWILIAIGASACGGDDDSGGGGATETGCSDAQVEVDTFGGGADVVTVCEPVPAECNGTASCADQACIAALYGLCKSPAIGAGCSDTFPPTIVSCNE